MSNNQMVSVPEGFMLVERSIWTEQQVEAATACITRLKGVVGMRDRDLAMAAIDAAQCKAPDISLADILPAQQPQDKPVACAHEWTDDGEFMLVCTACGAQENHDPKWRHMASAPQDGTLVRLLVEFTEHATEDSDAMPSPTIGANSFDHTGEDVWQFAGWSWEQDCFTQGRGEPVGWLPLLDTPQADPAEVERLRDENRRLHDAGEFLDGVNQGIEDKLRAQLAERDALLREIHDGTLSGYARYSKIEAVLSASAEPSAPHEEARWHPLTAPGQIQEGDRLSFRVGSSFICARARQIIAPGTDKEEVVYNRKKNHYFLTSMAVDGTSSHKNVMVARVTA